MTMGNRHETKHTQNGALITSDNQFPAHASAAETHVCCIERPPGALGLPLAKYLLHKASEFVFVTLWSKSIHVAVSIL